MAGDDFDLPDPQPRPQLSPAEYELRNFNLYKNLLLASVLYGTLHKVILPLALSKTTVLIRDYTQVDFWAIPGLFLAFYLFRAGRFNAIASALAGALVAYAAWDANAIFAGQHRGWLAWSHAISSLPQGFVAIVLLSSQRRHRSLPSAWLGAGIALAVLVGAKVLSQTSANELTEMTPVKTGAVAALTAAESCGASSLDVALRDLRGHERIQLEACGFRPVALLHQNQSAFYIDRASGSTMNVHVVFYNIQGQRIRQTNRILKRNESKVLLSEVKFRHEEVAAVLYSDTLPNAGKVLIVNALGSDLPMRAAVTPERILIWGKAQ